MAVTRANVFLIQKWVLVLAAWWILCVAQAADDVYSSRKEVENNDRRRLDEDFGHEDDDEERAQRRQHPKDIEDRSADGGDDDIDVENANPGQFCISKGCKMVDENTARLIKYNNAFKKEIKNRNKMKDPVWNPAADQRQVPLKPTTKYLGVLLDAGRHYFPIEWIKNMLVILNNMQYNLLHFRLTDDQAFNILLDSQPNLANPANHSGGLVYTPDELRDLVKYAHDLGIVIMPEVNVPGHAAAWAGKIPDIILPCAQFICSYGYGLPLNINHPKIYDIIKDVIQEVKQIFSTSPYIHLGGDEVNMAGPCFSEAGVEEFDFNIFEEKLDVILKEIGIDDEQVLRWEMTGQRNVRFRVGGIAHYWETKKYQNATVAPSVFVSQGLYFDTNAEMKGYEIHHNVKEIVDDEAQPIGVIVGGFELGTEFWMDRNMIGRMLAVQMGMSDRHWDDSTDFNTQYKEYCKDYLKLDDKICELVGQPTISHSFYHSQWSNVHSNWHRMLCERLTITESYPQVTARYWAKKSISSAANAHFWERFDESRHQMGLKEKEKLSFAVDPVFNNLQTHQVKYSGVVLDLVRIENTKLQHQAYLETLGVLASLGFNTIQLKVMSDIGFALDLEHLRSQAAWGITDQAFDEKVLIKNIREEANRLGIQIIPEMSLATRAGGWYGVGPMLNCPNVICDIGQGIGVNVTDPSLFAAIASMAHDMVDIFQPPLVHFGHDEREEIQACYDEAGVEQDLQEFERRIEALLEFEDYSEEHFMRWENKESKVYSRRAGDITHYQYTIPKDESSSFFLSTGLDLSDVDDENILDAFSVYQQTRKLMAAKPTGILATVSLVHPRFWKDFAIKERLLGMSIALSGAEHTSKESFQQKFDKYVSALNITDVGGFVNNRLEAKKNIETHLDIRKKQTCNSRVSNVQKIKPKFGVLTIVNSTSKGSRKSNDDEYYRESIVE